MVDYRVANNMLQMENTSLKAENEMIRQNIQRLARQMNKLMEQHREVGTALGHANSTAMFYTRILATSWLHRIASAIRRVLMQDEPTRAILADMMKIADANPHLYSAVVEARLTGRHGSGLEVGKPDEDREEVEEGEMKEAFGGPIPEAPAQSQPTAPPDESQPTEDETASSPSPEKSTSVVVGLDGQPLRRP